MRLSFASLKENFGLVATLLGFIADIITLIALINSKVPPTIPFIDYPLDGTTQLVILAIATVTYLGFLQGYWLQLRRRTMNESAYSFLGFLVYDIVLHFKYPFLLVPIFILVGFLFVIIPGIWSISFIGFAFIFFSLLLWITFQIEKQHEKQEWSEIFAREKITSYEELVRIAESGEPNLSSRWKERIEEELDKDSYATDFDLAQMYDCSRSMARKAIRSYFRSFESQKKLKLSKEKRHSKTSNSGSVEVLSLSLKH
jgi:ribosomal protein S25